MWYLLFGGSVLTSGVFCAPGVEECPSLLPSAGGKQQKECWQGFFFFSFEVKLE